MESIIHSRRFGDIVRSKRNEMKHTQIEFYKFLFPDTEKEDENIKKKMNAIENGKQKTVDFDFFLAMCSKCDVSADYLVGIDVFENKDVKYICEYTGLSQAAIKQLHSWKKGADNGADLSLIGQAFWGDEGEKAVEDAYVKQTSTQYLRILNHLFAEHTAEKRIEGKKRSFQASNVSVFYALYTLCFARPSIIHGNVLIEETLDGFERIIVSKHPELVNRLERAAIDATSPMVFKDDSEVWYSLNVKDVLEQISRRNLDKAIERLLQSISEE